MPTRADARATSRATQRRLRAMMLAKIKVGVQLDADQFVAPGVDNMFASTAREITKEYPRIIMPAHFLDRAPRDGGAWWKVRALSSCHRGRDQTRETAAFDSR